MADLASVKLRPGTPIVFGQASSTTVAGSYTTTNAITLDALASGSGRMSVEVDLNDANGDLPELLLVLPAVETGTAPTAGGTMDYYLAFGFDGTNYPAGVTGADAAWPSDGNEDEWRVQLGDCYPVVVTNDGNTIQLGQPYWTQPLGRYMACVGDNNMSQATRNETTDSDNGSGVVVIPFYRELKS